MKLLLTVLLCVFTYSESYAQKFWLTTYAFPGDHKTSITLANDNYLFVGSPFHVHRSLDSGHSWDTVLNSSAVLNLFTSTSGRVLAGGLGKILFSDDLGNTWDSVSLGNTYPVTKIIQNKDGNLFAITGTLDVEQGYVGAGVYYSNDNGNTWSQRNNGLGSFLSCEQITSDKNGRLYLGVPDEYVTGNGGLFISDNNGLQWEHINILIDGKNVVSDNINIANVKALSVSPEDSLYFSFSGTAVNVSVTLNAYKSINDIRANSFWNVRKVANVATWWNDRQLNPIHFAKNGDWYSSMNGSINVGGTFFSTDKGQTWNKHIEGLGFDISGYFNIQHLAENSSGKIYMVQMFDERVYQTDISIPTSVHDDNSAGGESSIFPNLVAGNSPLHIHFSDNTAERLITVSNLMGKVFISQNVHDSFTMNSPEEKGMWFIHIHEKGNVETYKIIVY